MAGRTRRGPSRGRWLRVNVSWRCSWIYFQLVIFTDTSLYPDDLYQAGAPPSLGKLRSKSADRKKKGRDEGDASDANNMRGDSQFIHESRPDQNVRNVMLSEDSGNCSLNTSSTDSRKSAYSCDNLNSDREDNLWVKDSDDSALYSHDSDIRGWNLKLNMYATVCFMIIWTDNILFLSV